MMRNRVELHKNAIYFYIDNDNKNTITNFLKEKGCEKLLYIIQQISNQTATKDVYSLENYDNNIKNVTAIKLKAKQFNNARIYCKDYEENGQRIIVLCELLSSKKQANLTHKEKNLIQKVNNYEY